MPELDPLPGRPRVPDFTPRTGDYAAVVGRAKNRRRKHLGAAGAGMAGVAAVVALSAGAGGGTFGLQPVQPAAPGYSVSGPSPSPEESPSPAPSQAAATRQPARPGDPAPPPASPAPEPGRAEPDPGEEAVDDGPRGEEPRPLAVRPVFVRDTVPYNAVGSCWTDPSVVAATGWCLGYDGPERVRVGDVHTYRVLACRVPGRGAKALRFASEQQIDFRLLGNEGETEWQWSAGYPFPRNKTSVEVADSACARWSVEWDATKNDGTPLAVGHYSMNPDVLAPLSDEIIMATGTAYSFEVTG